MQDDDVSKLLKNDFENLSAKFEKDEFARRILYKLHKKQRARLGVIAFTAGIGAAFAASQVPAMIASLTPAVSTETQQAWLNPQLLATMMLAALLCATAFLLRQEG